MTSSEEKRSGRANNIGRNHQMHKKHHYQTASSQSITATRPADRASRERTMGAASPGDPFFPDPPPPDPPSVGAGPDPPPAATSAVMVAQTEAGHSYLLTELL